MHEFAISPAFTLKICTSLRNILNISPLWRGSKNAIVHLLRLESRFDGVYRTATNVTTEVFVFRCWQRAAARASD